MKGGVDITLREIHRGDCRVVVTLGLNGDDPAHVFLLTLLRDDSKRFESIKTRIAAVSNYDHYENQITFRHVGDRIFEFKRPGIRLYAFYDEIEGLGHLILCTNGGKKNTKRGQQADIAFAKKCKATYLDAKLAPNTRLNYQEPDP